MRGIISKKHYTKDLSLENKYGCFQNIKRKTNLLHRVEENIELEKKNQRRYLHQKYGICSIYNSFSSYLLFHFLVN